MSVCFEGKRRELRSLYGKMKRLEERKKPLVENGFYNPKRWLGNLVTRLGADWRDVYCRGTWDFLKLKKDHLYFFTETAWHPPFDLLKLIQKCYPSLVFYFTAEGDGWDSYLTNDADGKYFSCRYVVDMEPDIEYFDTIDEACKHVSAYIGKHINATWEDLCKTVDEWNEDNPDADWSICVKQIEVISNEELWDT